MERRIARRWGLSFMLATASLAGCASSDPPLPEDKNPVVVTSKPPPPISGGTMLVTNTGTAVAADSDRDVVWLVDLGSLDVARIDLSEGDEPGRIVEGASGRIHVALRGTGEVATIDLAARKVLDRTSVCPAPRGLAFDPVRQALHVACAGGELVTLPEAGGAPTRTLHFPERDLRDVLVQGDRLLVTRFRSVEVLMLDADGSVVSRKRPAGVNGETLGVGASFTPTVAWRAVAAPGGGALIAHQLSADSPVTISEPGGYGSSGSDCDASIVNSTVTVVDPSGTPSQSGSPPVLTGMTLPVDLAIDATGNVAVVSAGSNKITFSSSSELASNPGCTVTNNMTLPGQPVSVVSSGKGFVVQIREPAQIVVVDPSSGPGVIVPLAATSRADSGHTLFHHEASATSHVACASCHPEGNEDNHVWVFDTLGQRRTQTVAGGVLATAPLHWNGDMHDIGMIMSEVFVHRMGGAKQGPRHVEAFGEWLDTLPAFPPSSTASDAQVEHGRQLFMSANVGCVSCHSGEHFTNNRNEDVGTGRAFQVPTLVGVSTRAPFMHDGCAATLRDRFDPAKAACNGGDRHGHTASLASADVDDLIAYLETL